MLILGIETSCDETACSIINAKNDQIKVLASIVSSQVKLHSKWGGVVPNLAAREHLKNILTVTEECFKKAGKKPVDLDLIAITNGPGLIPALLIGVNSAKTFSYAWQKPLLGIHHIEGHIYANFIGNKISAISKIIFPILCLVVSGGHTQLILMEDHLKYEIVGETQDDAAGEAFDKVARILGLGYPGGPIISEMAEKFKAKNLKLDIDLPRPMLRSENFNFSFSGLKTAVLYLTKKNSEKLKDDKFIQEVAFEFQQAVIDVLVEKTLHAAKKFNPKTIMLAGGVSANQELRKQLGEKIKAGFPTANYSLPDLKYSIDNAAMIAAAGYYRWKKLNSKEKISARRQGWKKIQADANLKLK